MLDYTLLNFLKSNPSEEFSIPDLAHTFSTSISKVETAILKVVADGRAIMIKAKGRRSFVYKEPAVLTPPRVARIPKEYHPPVGAFDRVREVYPEDHHFVSFSSKVREKTESERTIHFNY